MDYKDLVGGIKRFGSTRDDIATFGLGISADQINENVIVAPWWEPMRLPLFSDATFLSISDFAAIKIWNISLDQLEITYIKTGIGAPVLMDAVLALGETPCKRAIFIGAVGALDKYIEIGDIVIPEYSMCGDGASRYILSDNLSCDSFGMKAYPNQEMFDVSLNKTRQICEEYGVSWHRGQTFSIDTVFAQFAHIDEILALGCNTIEMESAAAFSAAALANIQMSAIFSASDNTVQKKSLVSGRKEEEIICYKKLRQELIPKIAVATFRALQK